MKTINFVKIFGFSLVCASTAFGAAPIGIDRIPIRPIDQRPRVLPVRPVPVDPTNRVPIGALAHLTPIQVNPNIIEVQRRGPAIGFQPFELKDPTTGGGNQANAKQISRDAILTFPDGKKVQAGAYYDQLNQFEQNVNQSGYSLRTKGEDRIEIQKTRIDLRSQRLQLDNIARTHSPLRVDIRRNLSQAQIDHAIAKEQIVAVKNSVTNRIQHGQLKLPQSFHGEKNWNAVWGWTNSFGAFVDASVVVDGTYESTQSRAQGNAGGYLFGQQLKIVRGETSNNAPQSGNLSGNNSFYFLGIKLFDKSYDAADPLFYHDEWSKGLDENTTIYFVLGIVPMSATIGAAGSAGLDFRMDLLPLHANSNITPNVASKIYIQVGVDILVGGAGGGSDLILINDSIDVVGRMQILSDASGPYFITDLESADNMLALQGRVYAYVFVYVPAWDLPPWHKKQWDWTIFQLDGFAANGSLFSYQNKLYL